MKCEKVGVKSGNSKPKKWFHYQININFVQNNFHQMTDSNKSHCFECFRIEELINSLTAEQMQQLQKHKVEIRFRKGEIICKQGTFASNIGILKEGLVKVYLEFNDRNLILRVETAGQLIGLQALCGNNLYYYTCVAYEDSLVELIDINYFKQLMQENATFGIHVFESLTESNISSYDRMICLTQKKSHGRLADILLCLSERIYKSDKFKTHFPRKDLAELSNMSIENLARTINDLKKDNVVNISGNNIEITNKELLRTISKKG